MSSSGDNTQVFAVRPPAWTRWITLAPLLFLTATVITTSLEMNNPVVAFAMGATIIVSLVLLALWWLHWAVIRITVTPDEVRFSAPFHRSVLERRDIVESVVLGTDDFAVSGLDWVTTGKPKAAYGIKLTLGGPAAIRVRTYDGRMYTVVFPSQQDAWLAASAIGA